MQVEYGTEANTNSFSWNGVWNGAGTLANIMSGRYQKNLIGFSWWNETWQNDSNPEHDTTMRVQNIPKLKALFREAVGNNPAVIGEILP